MTSLRPDEQATESEIRKARSRTNDIRSGLETISSLGVTGIGAKAASKILPLLSQYIPEDLAFKGINKIMPNLGNFLKEGMKQGLSLKSGLDFLKENIESKQENPVIKQAKDFETNYPDVVKGLMYQINDRGQSPDKAAEILKHSISFKEKIKKIEKETGKNFIDFVLEMMGGQQNAGQMQQQSGQAMQQPGGQGMQPQTQGIPNQTAQPPGQAQGQGLDPQLAQIMQGIRSTIQGIRGNG